MAGVPEVHISQLVVDSVDASSIDLPAVRLQGATAAVLCAFLVLQFLGIAVQCAVGCLLVRDLRRRPRAAPAAAETLLPAAARDGRHGGP